MTTNFYKRYCKTLELKDDPELIAEYKRVHAPAVFWSEITHGMRDVGIVSMEIYIHNTQLFMIMDTVTDFDPEHAMAELARKPRQQEWEKFVSRFQKTSPDATAGQKWQVLERIFRLE